MATVTDFDTMRTWEGSQSRAFEELAYQLLKDSVPAGTQAIRTANPDGGVEWYVTFPDGTEWGWQAKHIHGIDSLLTGMEESVRRVAKERPKLRKLFFVISCNLATGKSGAKGKTRKSQREKYQDKIVSWKSDIPGVSNIDFELIQGSDLLSELAKPAHRGRRWFWWDEVVLGDEWMREKYRQQADAAGGKYRPDLQVDVPIQEDLQAIGFDQSVLDVFNGLLKNVSDNISEVQWESYADGEERRLAQAIRDHGSKLEEIAHSLVIQAGDASSLLDPLRKELGECITSINDAYEYESPGPMKKRSFSQTDINPNSRPSNLLNSYGIDQLHRSAYHLSEWLGSNVGRCFSGPCAYFLSGSAGSGKTHLLLDATRRALEAGRPAVFLEGAGFGKAEVWASIADQLGLGMIGSDRLLEAMDTAGEAASSNGRRFVIFIDALNETTPSDFWSQRLPIMRSTIARYPHIALVVSCRDTYQDLVLEQDTRSSFICRSHPGFAGREVEATQRYFDFNKLETPRIPLLTPEFTLPLFLNLYCQSVTGGGIRSIRSGHEGRIHIFERYLDVKCESVARRYASSAASGFELRAAKSTVRQVLDAVLDEMSRQGREIVSSIQALEAARGCLADINPADAARILGLWQEEGVLICDRLYLGNGQYEEGMRVTFQAFADFLLLQRHLELSDDPLNNPSIKAWLTDQSSRGIIEAATILFPERYDVELPDYLDAQSFQTSGKQEGSEAGCSIGRSRALLISLVRMLPYRDAHAISKRTIELLNQSQQYIARQEFYQILFTLAPQRDNPLNGDRLHGYLAKLTMPKRDHDFGFATYHEMQSDNPTPTIRLSRWAAAGPYPDYSPQVIELSCIPLCWLLSSPDRFMRDWITKALVQLLHGHLDVMLNLVNRFWTVNDPYVVERIILIAYGSLLRSSSTQSGQAKTLASRISDLVFTPPVRADELMLDAGRGIVRWAVFQELLPKSSLRNSLPPYGLKRPGVAPTQATLDTKYGWHANEPASNSYSSIYASVLGLGDFGRYVVESGVQHFSRYLIGHKGLKEQQHEPHIIKSHWTRFLASLSAEQKQQLRPILLSPGRGTLAQLALLEYRGEDPLTAEQRTLLRGVFSAPKHGDSRYSADQARRWVFAHTLALGWTPELFGEQDRLIGHGRGREAHKAERWGKKYEWIAYHELLARIADHYQPFSYDDENQDYEGCHQIIGTRDIDPTLRSIGFDMFHHSIDPAKAARSAQPTQFVDWPVRCLDFTRYHGNIHDFLNDTTTEPTIESSLFVYDGGDDQWVALDGYVETVDPRAPRGWRGLQERCRIDTLLVADGDSEALLEAIHGDPHYDTSLFLDANGHIDCCYLGEVGRAAPSCCHQYARPWQIAMGDQTFTVAATTESCTWEGNIQDCSLNENDGAYSILPSTFIQRTAKLTGDEQFTHWMNGKGETVCSYETRPDGKTRVLLIRASFLKGFLSVNHLELLVFHWFDRIDLSGDSNDIRPFVDSRSEALVSAELKLHKIPLSENAK